MVVVTLATVVVAAATVVLGASTSDVVVSPATVVDVAPATDVVVSPATVVDVAPATVDAVLRKHGYPRMIHGHTHRPALHHHTVDGKRCERWVLADWYHSGSYLRVDAAGCRSIAL